jgi:hypothetical protein
MVRTDHFRWFLIKHNAQTQKEENDEGTGTHRDWHREDGVEGMKEGNGTEGNPLAMAALPANRAGSFLNIFTNAAVLIQ